MKISKIIAVALAAPVILTSTLALASTEQCSSAPKTQWRTADDAKVAAEALGYKNIRSVKVEDGCYEVYAFSKEGRRAEVHLNPLSLKIVRVKNK